MNTIATFDNTVGILVKAYLEGTLMKGECCACAVGNICAAANGISVVVERRANPSQSSAYWSTYTAIWQRVFITYNGKKQRRTPTGLKIPAVKQQIDSTGYDWRQLARIERAFETAAEGYSDEAEFAGLMAVVDVLAKIHGIDLTTDTAAKALFVKA